jgi:NhaP-type Na+/H+ or K+/H+ antiporter
VGLILVLAVGSQVLASRLRIPALIILLPAGFTGVVALGIGDVFAQTVQASVSKSVSKLGQQK